MSITLVQLNPRSVFKTILPFIAAYGMLIIIRFLCLPNPELIVSVLATFIVEAFAVYPLMSIHKFFLWTDFSNKFSFYNEKKAAEYLEKGLKELYLA